ICGGFVLCRWDNVRQKRVVRILDKVARVWLIDWSPKRNLASGLKPEPRAEVWVVPQSRQHARVCLETTKLSGAASLANQETSQFIAKHHPWRLVVWHVTPPGLLGPNVCFTT